MPIAHLLLSWTPSYAPASVGYPRT